MLHVAALFALAPEPAAAAAEVDGPAGGERFVPGRAIHVGDHQHLAGGRILGDGGHQTVGPGEVGNLGRSCGHRNTIVSESSAARGSPWRQHSEPPRSVATHRPVLAARRCLQPLQDGGRPRQKRYSPALARTIREGRKGGVNLAGAGTLQNRCARPPIQREDMARPATGNPWHFADRQPKESSCRTDRLTIVLPVYNGESRLAELRHQMLELASDLTSHFSIMIVDDGSTDDTSAVAKELSTQYPQVTVRTPTATQRPGADHQHGAAARRLRRGDRARRRDADRLGASPPAVAAERRASRRRRSPQRSAT